MDTPGSATDPTAVSSTVSAGQLINRCLESKSPYVRSHADNPTAWQLWTPETLDLARRTNKLLFVSIGYSACHWCHVMAHESFDHPRIAKLLNDNFIPIKIDREERPDIDRVYMDFLQATTGGGGWPLNVFVTPQLQPLFGGTYWPGPNSEMPGRGGSFEVILEKVAQTWHEQESKCREDAGRITAQLRQFAQEGTLAASRTDSTVDAEAEPELPDLEMLEDAYEHYKMRYDDKFGGFGGAPKFPTPAHLSFLLRLGRWPSTVTDIVGEEEIADAQDMAVKTLLAMAKGGIKDQVGNGFSRYSVTRDWSLPHFEKMLYDNSQLLNAYLDAYLITKDPLLLDTVHDIATYLSSDLIQSQTGGFHASEDADSAPSFSVKEHKEGAFYVWSLDEFKRVISDDKAAEMCAEYYNVKPGGNVSSRFDAQGELEGLNTLTINATIPDLASKHSVTEEEIVKIISSSNARLLQYRDANRPRPHLDDKIVTSWNGLAISGLARTAAAFATLSPDRSSTYLQSALRSAEFIHKSLYDSSSKTLLRVYREGPGSVPGFADDYAFLISGLLDLYAATFDEKWLEWAHDLQETQIKLFYDEDRSGGFFSTPKDSEDILIRSKDAMDNAEPSTNGVSAVNLFRLDALLKTTTGSEGASAANAKVHEKDLHSLALKTIRTFEVEMGQHPGLMTGLLAGVVISRLELKSVLLSGKGAKVDSALKELREGVWPGVVVLKVSDNGPGEWLKSKNEVLASVDPAREMVQVCSGTQCMLVDQPGDLAKLLTGL
ncbi:hypothetical protein K461DRAFT_222855 [Myriangium duriaei CBS 260.36]|uniref:Spermatogenesis-associated protein 20-like TRX domain-containing protein n=1 Tax=Myriangium duriaei CBS 260.36 TaxID=1168546 RepID=A0A9P4J4B2_9PEZI|nr:hypothetical protein K461DRAFT_222855 [Myriangium duriaei CBS 260.36]